jgi:hypothetical protein
MAEAHEGGCLCGAVRYQATGQPMRATVCHCTFCQRITGSAFGVWVTYRKEQVALVGEYTTHEHRSDESGRWIKMEYCPRCGTSIGATFERSAELRSQLAGTFDDPSWISITRHIWTRSARPWVPIPEGVPRFEKQAV